MRLHKSWPIVIWLVGAAIVFVVICAGLWTAPRWLVPQIAARSPRCLYAAATTESIVALTIDDGPDATYTPAILRVLVENDAHATFFLISGNVPGAESVVTELAARGNEIGNHLTSDEPSITLAPDAFVRAIREAHATLSRFGTVRWLRPGSAWYNGTMLDAIEREGHRCALASVYPFDGYNSSPRLSAAYILANTRPGAIIALHDRGQRSARTAEVLRRVLPELRSRGYQVGTLSELTASLGPSPNTPRRR